MAIQNKFGFMGSIPPMTKNLIIINFLCWFASLALPKVGIDLVQWLGLHFPGASDFYPHQFITYMFMHDTHSLGHIFFNMFAVYMFGRILEEVWGSKRFLLFYLVTGVGAAVVQETVWLYLINSIAEANQITLIQQITMDASLNGLITIGASGAVFGILLAFGMLFPNAPLYIFFIPIPVKAKYFVIFYGVIELFSGVAHFSGDNVAHFAHLGGMLFGFFMIIYWKKKDRNNEKYFY
ncbi:MAG: rhomboid family intramembrane serine protease [Tannerella sp.]|jgi:membrane associated rhomboid family serine protease|nr:rhomboid family intramembrane serine protease [Tannerella sp.]